MLCCSSLHVHVHDIHVLQYVRVVDALPCQNALSCQSHDILHPACPKIHSMYTRPFPSSRMGSGNKTISDPFTCILMLSRHFLVCVLQTSPYHPVSIISKNICPQIFAPVLDDIMVTFTALMYNVFVQYEGVHVCVHTCSWV